MFTKININRFGDYANGQFSHFTGEGAATRKKMKARALKEKRVELFQKLMKLKALWGNALICLTNKKQIFQVPETERM